MLRYLLVRSDRHVSQGDKIAMSAGRQQSYHAFHTFRAFRAASSISAKTIDDDPRNSLHAKNRRALS